MHEIYTFHLAKRMVGIRYPIILALGLSGLLAWFRPHMGSWKFWALAAAIALMVVRTARYLLGGNQHLLVTATGLTRSGRTIAFQAAELELQTDLEKNEPVVSQVILWEPRDERGARQGVGFESSLKHFDRAVKAVIGRVPESRIVVTAFGDKNVRDERREKVIARYRRHRATRGGPPCTSGDL